MTGLTEIQLSGMGTALVNGGSSLIKIGIQLMPYAIAFVVITFVFYYIYHLITRLNGPSKRERELQRRYDREKANSYSSWSDYESDPFR